MVFKGAFLVQGLGFAFRVSFRGFLGSFLSLSPCFFAFAPLMFWCCGSDNRSSSNLFSCLSSVRQMALTAASQCLQPRRHSTQLSAHRPPSLLRSRVHTIAFLRPAGTAAAESTSRGPSGNWNKLCCRRRQELLRIRPLVLLPSPKDVSVRAVDDGRGEVPSKVMKNTWRLFENH